MALEADIVERVCGTFDADAIPLALQELSSVGKTGQLARCIVVAAGGSVERLRYLIGMAEIDPRDVIVAGEYDSAMRRVRDLRVSFLIDSPDHFWVSRIAMTAYSHGYHLAKLETQALSTPPFAGKQTQGRATFKNDERTFTVRKQNALWSIALGGCNLAPFGLDSPLADEDRFRIQLDFLLSRAGAQPGSELRSC